MSSNKLPTFGAPVRVSLDYGEAAADDVLNNISAVAAVGDRLWTASDEGRTLECLEPDGDGYRLRKQILLDAIFPDLPEGEADVEALNIADGMLWVCGSHCRVRRKPKLASTLNPDIRTRRSRHLCGRVPLTRSGDPSKSAAESLPFSGPGSLRRVLRENEYIEPFVELPSKEGGVDIEGLLVAENRLFFGLRGPVVDSVALVVEVVLNDEFDLLPKTMVTHFIDLGGLGIRDLAWANNGAFIIAGPTSEMPGPFRICRWLPSQSGKIQEVDVLHRWKSINEKPEGMCPLRRNEQDGLMVVYDRPNRRIDGVRYEADWFPIT